MRKTVIAGNWKMFKDVEESEELLRSVKAQAASAPPFVTVVVCPPCTSLHIAGKLLNGSPVKLGAQNMSEHDEGAFTGEISWKMLKSTGCEYVILGHSERRQYYGETDGKINLKAKKALANGLLPILCVGETLKEREGGITEQIVATQLKGVLDGISMADMERVIIAYEPVWAIGTGKNATPGQAQDVHAHIRGLISKLYSKELADKVVIQYGGSVKPDNAAELLAQHDIDGALVGGACLKADSFAGIFKSARQK